MKTIDRREFVKDAGMALITVIVVPAIVVGSSKAILSGGMGTSTAEGRVGKNFNKFTLIFPDKYFDESNLIVGPSNTPIHIVKILGRTGRYNYICEIFTNNPELSIPRNEMKPGTLYCKDWSIVEHTPKKRRNANNL